jgi:L-rhamnose 1-dehydrogenase
MPGPIYPILANRSCAVTGGLTGIGRAIALGFLAHGAKVAINYLGSPADEPRLIKLKGDAKAAAGGDESRFAAVAGDVANPETGKALVAEAVKRWGRLDVFVSNAGVCEFAEFLA